MDNVRDLVGKTEDRPQNVILADSVGSQPEVPIMMDTHQHSHLHCPESAELSLNRDRGPRDIDPRHRNAALSSCALLETVLQNPICGAHGSDRPVSPSVCRKECHPSDRVQAC